MSFLNVVTKKGDSGTTGTLFGERKCKSEKIFQILGEIDELNVYIGASKIKINQLDLPEYFGKYVQILDSLQINLFNIMGELNCSSKEQHDIYIKKFQFVKDEDLNFIENEIELLCSFPELEQKDWVKYDKTEVSIFLDLASKKTRTCERFLVDFMKDNEFQRRFLIKYFNRLSDFFYVVARYFDFTLKINK